VDDEKGFSLLEVLTGVMIFAFGMLGVAALLIATVRDNSFSGSMSEANLLMASKVDVLLNMVADYNSEAALRDTDLDGIGGIDDVGPAADHVDHLQGKNGKFEVYWNVAKDVPITNTKTIAVSVNWKDKDSDKQVSSRVIMAEE